MALQVLCVYTDADADRPSNEKPLNVSSDIPFGLALIATVLKEAGHDVRILVLRHSDRIEETLANVFSASRPRLICLTAVSSQFLLVRRVAEAAKSLDSTVYVALGGPHATLNPESSMECGAFDALCVGEGERAVVELCSELQSGRDPSGIPNLRLRRRGQDAVEKNPPAPFNEDLDNSPFIDRQMWYPWIEHPFERPAVLVGRGCPNRCTFCSNHALRKITTGKYLRFRSPENVIAEVAQLAVDPRVTEIHLEVETISANPGYAFDLCKALEEFNAMRSSPVRFRSNLSLSARLVADEPFLDRFLEAFRRANILDVNVGLESGSERIRREVLRRPPYSNEDFIGFCSNARNFGIQVRINVMIGLPGETPEDWNQTLDVLKQSRPAELSLSVFYPYAGTELYELAKSRGMLANHKMTSFQERREPVLNLPGFPTQLVLMEYLLCKFKVFPPHGPKLKRWLWSVMSFLSRLQSFGRFYVWVHYNTGIGAAVLATVRKNLG